MSVDMPASNKAIAPDQGHPRNEEKGPLVPLELSIEGKEARNQQRISPASKDQPMRTALQAESKGGLHQVDPATQQKHVDPIQDGGQRAASAGEKVQSMHKDGPDQMNPAGKQKEPNVDNIAGGEGPPRPVDGRPRRFKIPPAWRPSGRYPLVAGVPMLGKGGFGFVYRCHDLLNPSRNIAKKRQLLPVDNPEPDRYIRREVEALRHCQGHPAVVELWDVLFNPNPPQPYVDLVLPLAMTSLDRVVRLNRQGLERPVVKTMMQQVVQGLAWIHGRGWLHLDLKPHNVLLFRDGSCKISDFGLARRIDPDRKLVSPTGTLGYRPPEEMFNIHFAIPSMDVWPIATMYAELRKGWPIFDTSSEIAYFKSMLDLVGTDTKSVFRNPGGSGSGVQGGRTFHIRGADYTRISVLFPSELSFLLHMWKLEPEDRCSAADMARHTFWKEAPAPSMKLIRDLLSSGRLTAQS
jgi:cyclin-dependent kinase